MNEVNVWIQPKLLKAWLSGKRFIVAYGGRGSAKSKGAAKLSITYMLQHPNCRILCIRGTQNKISESSMQTIKEEIASMKVEDYFDISENIVKCKNGGEFLFYGAKSYQSFKSLAGINLVWIDEATELSKEAWEVLIPSIREDGSRFIVTFNPEKEKDWVYQNFILQTYPNSCVVKINWYDNPFFPNELKEQMEYDRVTSTAKYNHIWEGELALNIEGALFKSEWIDYEDIDPDDCERVVVAIDPSGTSKASSDACGLVVSGKIGQKYYVLDDCTGIMSPASWASSAIALYNKYNADFIVYESNFGGDIVKTVLQQIDSSVPVHEVRASRGKLVRAEPVAVLYENKQVLHTKKFKDLEYELITYSGQPGQRSPNRLDALVYSITSMQEKKVHSMSNMNIRF